MGITERIRMLCDERGISIRNLERDLDIGNGTVRRWSVSIPSADVLHKAAKYFGVTVGYLLGESDNKEVEYYIDPEVVRIAQSLKDNPDLKILFDVSKELSKEEINAVLNVILMIKGR